MYFINGLYTLASGAINIFQAANPGAGVANGTQITAAWLNDVQGELLNPLTVAGVAPAASTPTQVLQALKRIFGGNRLAVTANTTLTADNAGLVVVNAASGNVVLTLPLNSSANGTPLEFVFMRTDTSANTVTVVDAGSDADAPGGATSLSVIAGTPLWLRGDGASVWDIVLASSTSTYLKTANNLSDLASLATALTNLGFSNSLGSSGYQKLPGGLILQWGKTSNFSSETSQSVTFPIAFPNACLNAGTTLIIPAATSSYDQFSQVVGTPSTTGMSIMCQQVTNYTYPVSAFWFALGN